MLSFQLAVALYIGHFIPLSEQAVMFDAAGTIEGDVRVSGHPKVQKTFARVMGYVEQSDIHSPNVSVFLAHHK